MPSTRTLVSRNHSIGFSPSGGAVSRTAKGSETCVINAGDTEPSFARTSTSRNAALCVEQLEEVRLAVHGAEDSGLAGKVRGGLGHIVQAVEPAPGLARRVVGIGLGGGGGNTSSQAWRLIHARTNQVVPHGAPDARFQGQSGSNRRAVRGAGERMARTRGES